MTLTATSCSFTCWSCAMCKCRLSATVSDSQFLISFKTSSFHLDRQERHHLPPIEPSPHLPPFKTTPLSTSTMTRKVNSSTHHRPRHQANVLQTRLRKQRRNANRIHRRNVERLRICKLTLTRHPLGIAVFPGEIVANIVRLMNGPAALCFALTAPENYDIVRVVKREELKRTNCKGERLGLKGLLPQFEDPKSFHTPLPGQPANGPLIVSSVGKMRHEYFIRLLWQRLNQNCVYCGMAAEWAVNDGHLCRGSLIFDDARALAEPGAATDMELLAAITTQSELRSIKYDTTSSSIQAQKQWEKWQKQRKEWQKQLEEWQKQLEEWQKQWKKGAHELAKDTVSSLVALTERIENESAMWKTAGVDVDTPPAKVRGLAARTFY